MNQPGPNPSEPKFAPKTATETAAELTFIQKAASSILRLHQKDGRLPEGLSQEDLQEISVIADLDVMGAKAAAMGAMTGLVPGEALYVMWARARNALQLLGTVAMMRLADKMDNSRAPGDTRVLLKMVEWAGLPTPQEAPKDDAARLGQMTRADVGRLSDRDLHEKLMAQLRRE